MIRLFPLPGALPRHPAVEAWAPAGPPELRALGWRWFQEIRACGEDVGELLHDGHPTGVVGGSAFAYVAAFSRHVNVGFFVGAELPDPAGMLEGTGKFMRHVKVRPGVPVDEAALLALIRGAYALVKAEAVR